VRRATMGGTAPAIRGADAARFAARAGASRERAGARAELVSTYLGRSRSPVAVHASAAVGFTAHGDC
jgi:hypothetical protein